MCTRDPIFTQCTLLKTVSQGASNEASPSIPAVNVGSGDHVLTFRAKGLNVTSDHEHFVLRSNTLPLPDGQADFFKPALDHSFCDSQLTYKLADRMIMSIQEENVSGETDSVLPETVMSQVNRVLNNTDCVADSVNLKQRSLN